MNRSKKIFLTFAIIFLAIMVYIGYDISSRTTFPGSKPQLKERLLDEIESQDEDTLNTNAPKKVNSL
ncbi:MAG: hypothetical protein AAF363_06720 [Bacteroidota bacterium]